MPSFRDRLKHSWNAFMGRDPTQIKNYGDIGVASYARPDVNRLRFGSERTIISSIYNRIAIDVAATNIEHVRLDENGRFKDSVESGLNYCLKWEANVDQTGRAFIQDLVMSMMDEGVVAAVITDATVNPDATGSYQINELRVGKILEWYPRHVKVEIYNEEDGRRWPVILPKKQVAIIENPLYTIMNEPNSTLKRLIRKLSLMDSIDEQTSSGKLDIIIQLPYTIKSEAKKKQAEERRKDIEMQLSGSKYGIAYADATEHITQLNRSLENNLLQQIEYLQKTLYGQLGLTEAVFNGTANESEMLNYYNRTIEPILSAIADEFERKFLTKTARSQGQAIYYVRDPFKLAAVDKIAEIADKFTRNEILSSNELRSIVGYKPIDDPRADELRNKNLNQSKEDISPVSTTGEGSDEAQIDPYGRSEKLSQLLRSFGIEQ